MLENCVPAPRGSFQAIHVTVTVTLDLPKTRPELAQATRDQASSMMIDLVASEWSATRLLDKAQTAGDRYPRHRQGVRPCLTPSRVTRDKAMPVEPGRRRLSLALASRRRP